MQNWTLGQDDPDILFRTLRELAGPPEDTGIICFDYFDTLVVRHVAPEHTKVLAAHALSTLLGSTSSGPEIYAMRQQIEKDLCEGNAARGYDFEFDFFTLSAALLRKLRERSGLWLSHWTVDDFYHKLLALELAVEQGVQTVCQPVAATLQKVKEKGYTTILVSDFYVPGQYFDSMLTACQLQGLFDHIYVSSDYLVNKGSGRLYTKICEDLACTPKQLVMVGDNIHADINMAKQQGLTTVHIINPGQKEKYDKYTRCSPEETSAVSRRFLSALVDETPFSRMGYSLWFFTYRLFTQLVERDVRDVFFFSKEGEFLKLLFDLFQREVFGQVVVSSHYLLVSRKATFLPSLRPLAMEDFSRLFKHYRDISLRDFLLSLNIEEEIARTLCLDLELDYETRYMDLQHQESFAILIQSSSFRHIYESKRLEQRQNFLCYLDSFAVDYRREGLVIVDVGWKGSIQDNIFYILDGRVSLEGYYIGSFHPTEHRKNNVKKGLLFANAPSPSSFIEVYNNNRSLFEMMLGASHGSADGFYLQGQSAESPHRTLLKTIPGDKNELYVAVHDLPEERRIFNEVICPMQKKMYQLCSELNKEYLLAGCRTPDETWFARQHAQMVFTPSGEEVKLFTQLYHLENFGIFEFTNFATDARPSLFARIIHLKNVLRHPGVLETGVWPPVLLNGLGLGFWCRFDGMRRFWKAFHNPGFFIFFRKL